MCFNLGVVRRKRTKWKQKHRRASPSLEDENTIPAKKIAAHSWSSTLRPLCVRFHKCPPAGECNRGMMLCSELRGRNWEDNCVRMLWNKNPCCAVSGCAYDPHKWVLSCSEKFGGMSPDSTDEPRVHIDVTDTTDTEVDEDYKKMVRYMSECLWVLSYLKTIHAFPQCGGRQRLVSGSKETLSFRVTRSGGNRRERERNWRWTCFNVNCFTGEFDEEEEEEEEEEDEETESKTMSTGGARPRRMSEINIPDKTKPIPQASALFIFSKDNRCVHTPRGSESEVLH